MMIIQADHPFHHKIRYEFHFKDIDTHNDKITKLLAENINIYKECVIIEQKQLEMKGNKSTISVSVPLKSPFDKYIYTTIPEPFNFERTLVKITVDSMDAWYKWISYLKREYKIYTPPSISDLMQFLQEAPAC